MNSFNIALNRDSTIEFYAVQYDNNIPLKVNLEAGILDLFDPGAEVYIDFGLSDETIVTLGSYPIVTSFDVLITSAVLAVSGRLEVQARIKDSTGKEWRSEKTYCEIGESIEAYCVG